MAFGASAVGLFASTLGCDSIADWVSGDLPDAGRLLSQDRRAGHQVRDFAAKPRAPQRPSEKHHCVVIGAGVAGLSAAWHAIEQGVEEIVVLELEDEIGGTSRSGSLEGFQFPWGAHYLPVPKPDNQPLVHFLSQCGVLKVASNAALEVQEQYLCREPEERIFVADQWWGGLYPEAVATPADLLELKRFRANLQRLAAQRDVQGRPLFILPTRHCSTAEQARELDRISMSQWMDAHHFDSKPLRWLVDYACRDDYGLNADQTSAWAGLFYFAARIDPISGESQDVMTWPAGNGFLVDQLAAPLGNRLRLGQAVVRISPQDASSKTTALEIDVMDSHSGAMSTLAAEHVIVAVPQFIASRMLDAAWMSSLGIERETPPNVFSYGSWLVANVHLSERPRETKFPMSWDNVTMASGSLGYVNATHQLGMDHGPTVLTWYQAIPADQPAEVRQRLMSRTWEEIAETVIMDLELAHPDIRRLITRLDAMIWAHAMPCPRVGSIFHPTRHAAQLPVGNVHFACTDLSGIALFEEAFDHGRRAALECFA
ncbi:hypothetical protein CA85_34580 [Allorhodopirellula solitaria]|uniref:Amine oxidase domain-containing protein n=2 Tax=Allorhodopirellula solitaria TaxID=2527987 RepID=A0A5C5XRH7_9BACT|nr:hypothetical protein CA85_34580 [Allorhodopirellula solitaria]